jgi:AcrR family transcriptional regulator
MAPRAAKKPKANTPAAKRSPTPAAVPTLRTRDRILREAMRLFAEVGYEAATISQIEAAAGLSPGSGALYRHFASKQDILIAGVADIKARIDANRAAAQLVNSAHLAATSDADLTRILGLTHALVLHGMESGADLMLTLMRSGKAMPNGLRRDIEDWLSESMLNTARSIADRHLFVGYERLADDSVATAYVMMAPLMWSKVLEWNQDLPAGLTHERIRNAWVAWVVALVGEQGDRSGLAPPS